MPFEDILIDYYSVLDVAPDANLQDLKNAYRRRSKECHPDMGGTQNQFVQLNRAWAILSDPIARQAYDALRAAPNDDVTRAGWEPHEKTAHAKAEEVTQRYKKNWNLHWRWVDDLANDIAVAEYGKTKDSDFGYPEPTAGKSRTGELAIFLGFATGMALFIFFFIAFISIPHKQPSLYEWAGYIYFGFLISWAGIPPACPDEHPAEKSRTVRACAHHRTPRIVGLDVGLQNLFHVGHELAIRFRRD